jgi:hypothetical protein
MKNYRYNHGEATLTAQQFKNFFKGAKFDVSDLHVKFKKHFGEKLVWSELSENAKEAASADLGMNYATILLLIGKAELDG